MSKLKKSILAIIIALISTFIVGATANIVYGITGYVMLGTWQPGYTDGSCNSAIWSFTYPECEEGCGVQQQSTRDYVYRPATCTHDVEETYTVDVTDDEGNVTQETRTRTVKKTFHSFKSVIDFIFIGQRGKKPALKFARSHVSFCFIQEP